MKQLLTTWLILTTLITSAQQTVMIGNGKHLNTQTKTQFGTAGITLNDYNGYNTPTAMQLAAMYKNICTAKQTARPCIVFLGNSITHGAGATEQDSSWASVFMRWVQDQEGSPYEPAFTTNFYEGVPYPGTENMDSVKGNMYATGGGPGNAGFLTAGPVTIWFHGVYDYIDLCMTAPNGCTMQFYKDDVLYRTSNLSPSLAAQFTHNGVTTMGTYFPEKTPTVHQYKIVFGGLYAGINSLIRERYKQYDGSHRPFNFMRIATSGWDLNAYRPQLPLLATCLGDSADQKALVINTVSINDMLTSTADQYRNNLMALYDTLLAHGHMVVQLFPHYTSIRPNYYAFEAIAKAVCQERCIPFYSLSATDLLGQGHVPDNTHPDNVGHRAWASVLTQGLAAVLLNPPLVALASPSAQTICSASNITTIALSSGTAGTTYTWIRDNVTTVTGPAATGTGNISGTFINTTRNPVTVTFTITPFANGCKGTTIISTVLVNPSPIAVVTPAAQTICSASSINTIALSSDIVGTTYTWTRDNVATVTGQTASGTGNISGIFTNTTQKSVTVTFTIIPFINGCAGTTITATVLVKPALIAVATPAAQTICSASSIINIVLSSAEVNTTYAWTRDNTATVTGPAASGTGDISGVFTNITPNPATVTFTIIPFTNGCNGNTITAKVLVNPVTTMNSVSNQTACNGALTSAIIFSSSMGNTVTYNWASINSSIGLAATGTGNINAFIALNKTNTAVIDTLKVTPTANGCTGIPQLFTITINGQSTDPIKASSSITENCGTITTNLSVQGGSLGTATMWKWYAGSCGNTLIGTGVSLKDVIVDSTTTFYVHAEGVCGSTACASTTVTIHPQPIISIVASPFTSLLPTQTTTITASVSPTSESNIFEWYRNGTVITGTNGNMLNNISINQLGTYTAKVTTANGCIALSSPVVIIDSNKMNQAFLYPNPNNGKFKLVVYNNTASLGRLRNVAVYDTKGVQVYNHTMLVNIPYSVMDINLTNNAKGLYLLTVGDSNGTVLVSIKVEISQSL